jgi:hypothetical protein
MAARTLCAGRSDIPIDRVDLRRPGAEYSQIRLI